MRRREIGITCFVLIWTLVFHYESLRKQYLSFLAHRDLPKIPLLFPPAGWIMFFNIDPSYGFAEVYGIRHGRSEPIDPHRIFQTQGIGYDNIHRNMLIGVLDHHQAPSFCRYLRRKFPTYDRFAVLYGEYPDLMTAPDQVRYAVVYQCQ